MDSNYNLPSSNQGSHAYFNRKQDPRGQSFSHYTELKRNKLRHDLVGSAKTSLLQGHTIYATGHSKHLTFNEIRRIVGENGGVFVYHIEETGASTTEIIAEELSARKVEQYKKIPIVSAKWLVDSIRDNEIKPHFNYMHPIQKKMHEQFASVFFKVAKEYNDERGEELIEEFRFPDESNDPFSGLLEAPRVHALKGEAPSHLAEDDFQEQQILFDTSSLAVACEDIRTAVSSDVSFDPIVDIHLMERNCESAPPFARYLQPFIKAPETAKEEDKPVFEQTVDPSDDPWSLTMISDDQMSSAKAGTDNYIKNYQQRSRLHLLSSFKSYIKLYFQKNPPPGPTPSVLGAKMMLHIDFDAFFVSATLLDYPELADKPCCVSNGGKTSDVASSNYVARKKGVRNGMWVKQALEVCPDLVILPYTFSNYTKVSRLFYDILKYKTSIIIPTSMDEAVLDISGLGDPHKIAKDLKQEIFEQTHMTVSVGLGENVLLAKLANKYAKPNGISLFTPKDIHLKYGNSPVSVLPGMGYHLSQKLMTLNIKTVDELRAASLPSLTSVLGNKLGITFYNYARGVDNRSISNDQIVSARNSVSVHVNYGHRFSSVEDLFSHIYQLFKATSDKLVELSLAGHTLTVQLNVRQNFAPDNPEKYMGSGAIVAKTKSVTVTQFMYTTEAIESVGMPMITNMLKGCSLSDVRGSACTVTNLEAYDPFSMSSNVRSIEEAFMKPERKHLKLIELTPQQMLEINLDELIGKKYTKQHEILTSWLGIKEQEDIQASRKNLELLVERESVKADKFDDNDGRISVLAGVDRSHIMRWLAAYNPSRFEAWCLLGDLIVTEISLQRDLELLDYFIIEVHRFVQKMRNRKFKTLLDMIDENIEYFIGKLNLEVLK